MSSVKTVKSDNKDQKKNDIMSYLKKGKKAIDNMVDKIAELEFMKKIEKAFIYNHNGKLFKPMLKVFLLSIVLFLLSLLFKPKRRRGRSRRRRRGRKNNRRRKRKNQEIGDELSEFD